MTGREPLPGRGGPRQDPPPPDGEDNRTLTNVVLLVGLLILVGCGIWLVDAMLDARRADECMSAGRRNCTPLQVSPPPSR